MSRSRTGSFILAGCLALSASFPSFSQQAPREAGEPEAATGYIEKQALASKEYMVVAANPYASWAGKNIIENGGNAIDAAVAIQAMLTLVEPQSSGVGGGAFMLYWDNKTKTLHTFDGREMAPAGVNAYWFMEHGQPMKWIDAVVGGKSVGVPGVMKALETAHQQYGKLEWKALFTDAITTSEEGFKVSKRLEQLVSMAEQYHKGMKSFPSTATYFYPAGLPLKAGTVKKNPQLGKTLRNIAEQGTDYMYKGELAAKIAKAVQTANINPGVLNEEDLANYKVIERQAVCGEYRTKQVCGMAPPSSGGINVFQILKLLERFNLTDYAIDSPEFANLYTQASALAFADREKFIAPDKPWRFARAGEPFSTQVIAGSTLEQPNTSHFVIVDKAGNAVSMTTSVEFMFGSGLMVEGFLLNNQLTDFSFSPSENRFPVPNRVEPHKRPRSAMSPTMVFDKDGNLELLVGSPGGSRIVSYVAQTLIGVIDYGLDIQQAINLPKITNRNDYTALEKGTPIEALQAPLEALGHNVKIVDLNSGLHGIQVVPNGYLGGADPRREGVAVGR